MLRFILYVIIFFVLWYLFRKIIKSITSRQEDKTIKSKGSSNQFSNIEEAKFEDITDKKDK